MIPALEATPISFIIQLYGPGADKLSLQVFFLNGIKNKPKESHIINQAYSVRDATELRTSRFFRIKLM